MIYRQRRFIPSWGRQKGRLPLLALLSKPLLTTRLCWNRRFLVGESQSNRSPRGNPAPVAQSTKENRIGGQDAKTRPGAGTATCMSKYCSCMQDTCCGAFPWYFGQHGPVFFVTPTRCREARCSLVFSFSFQLRLPHHRIATAYGGSPSREPRTNPLQRNQSAVGFRRQSFAAAERTNALVCRARQEWQNHGSCRSVSLVRR